MSKKSFNPTIVSMILLGGSVAAFAFIFAKDEVSNAYGIVPAFMSVVGSLMLGKHLPK